MAPRAVLDLLEQASRWTCKNFAYTDEVVRGKITLLSKTPVSPEEAYAAFLESEREGRLRQR